eukprot:CAMPEP_0168558140 /NCGR_PEP_ID=MMETSP0413-20121227/9808_1 /TAXON_ID=136452 /ORGANISM="Filamoeba nolandi, Strain NC-AS-23-1" /LENGTH=104 /DNA_ID=CAMNT_0008589235 /DNA_START=683 /DNA_END=997 /DNA_ORIENTATION=+
MSYEGVVGGKLKLKGVAPKKTHKRKEKALTDKVIAAEVSKEQQIIKPADPRTEAEKKYEESQRKREKEKLAKSASKSHKQKLDEFNKYLGGLSEHYDIPKVGPG